MSVSVLWALHSPYPNGTWRGLEKCVESPDGALLLFPSFEAASAFAADRGLEHHTPVLLSLNHPRVGASCLPSESESVTHLRRQPAVRCVSCKWTGPIGSGRKPNGWRCPECDCHTYAVIDGTSGSPPADGREAYIAGYPSGHGMPHAVYMTDEAREKWLSEWAAADNNPNDRAAREEGFTARVAVLGERE